MKVLIISKSFIVKEAIAVLFRDTFNPKSIEIISNLEEIKKEELNEYNFIFIEIDLENKKEAEFICDNRKSRDDTRVMALDLSINENLFVKLVKHGIDGYITNVCNKEEFDFIVKNISNGKKYYDPSLMELAINSKSCINHNKLTKREKEVMEKVSKGCNNREVAESLCITEYTVKKHISSIFNKLDLRSRQDIIIYVKDNYKKIENL